MIALIIALLMAMMCLTACKNDENPTPTGPVFTPTDVDIKTYNCDEWKEEAEDGTRTYYTVLLTYTDDCYDVLTADDLKYSSNDGMIPLTDAFSDVTVDVINVNNYNKVGVCAYIRITSPKLIDMKKVHTLVEGPPEYDENIVTKEDYVSKNGSSDGWQSVLTNIVSTTPPYDEIEAIYTQEDTGVIRLYTNDRAQYWYEITDEARVMKGADFLTKYKVTPIKNSTLEDFTTNLLTNGVPINIVDGEIVETDLDERITLACNIVDGYVWIGFSTVDGSDFKDYDGEVPYAIVYPTNTRHLFCVEVNEQKSE